MFDGRLIERVDRLTVATPGRRDRHLAQARQVDPDNRGKAGVIPNEFEGPDEFEGVR